MPTVPVSELRDSHGRLSTQHCSIVGDEFVTDTRPRSIPDVSTSGNAHHGTGSRTFDQGIDAPSQLLAISRRVEKAQLTMDHQITRTADIRGHNRDAGRHPFLDYLAEGLALSGSDHHIERSNGST